jgi:hypothetical protein
MTFDDDSVRLHFSVTGPIVFRCANIGLEWPPPPELTHLAGKEIETMVRVSMSAMTDAQRAELKKEGVAVFRGADYRYKTDLEDT